MFENAKFGDWFITRAGQKVLFIKKDDELINKYLVAHPKYGALQVRSSGKALREDVEDPDDVVGPYIENKNE